MPTRFLVSIWLCVTALLGGADQAFAAKKVAFVVGVDRYDALPADRQLQKAVNDARAVGTALTQLGFDVVRTENAGRLEFLRQWQAFLNMVDPGDTAAFFFAGHGVEIGGLNYLLPRDLPKVGAGEEEVLKASALMLYALMEQLRARKPQVAWLILDACRDNPFIDTRGRGIGASRGLARIEASQGTFVMFSAGTGQTALDRLSDRDSDPNSIYTRTLIKYLSRPGLALPEIAREVRSEVLATARNAGHEQTPAYYDEVIGRFCPGGCDAPAGAAGPSPPDPAAQSWAAIKGTTSIDELEDFIQRFGKTSYGSMARERLRELRKNEVAVAVPPRELRPASPDPCGGTISASLSSRAPCPLSAVQERTLKPKDTFRECDGCPEMIVIPAGSFMMGSPPNEPQRNKNEDPQHKVTFAKAFAVGRFAVTFDEWDVCVAEGGCSYQPPDPKNWGRGRRPVINVSWSDAKGYLAWLSRKTGKTYRLLSEAEREYVTRSGTTSSFWTGSTISTNQANYNGNFTYAGGVKGDNRTTTMLVDSLEPNAWGLYHVHGNVWEWVEDCWHENYNGAPSDGSVWSGGDCAFHVMRGGSWFVGPGSVRAAGRLGYSAENRDGNDGGFRVARALNELAPSSGAPPPPARSASAVSHSAPLSPERERKLALKDTFKECDGCPEMIVVPAGSFMMGSPPNEPQRNKNEDPQHKVTFAKAFAVGRFAVTFDEWDACAADGGCSYRPPDPKNWGRGRRPVINVSWSDAKGYLGWLSRKTGKTYRLLSEAEREYVTRAGTTSPFWMGSTISTSQANYDGNFTYAGGVKGDNRTTTMPVDSFAPNAWGLYQVHGNVWEWVEDCWHENYNGAPSDGSVWSGGDCAFRMMRGGSWYVDPRGIRAAGRLGYSAGARDSSIGFRVARTLAP
jgi:formylglycine-generating enzyme required for sulfatase activity/uncharacterized caspase-like protein